MQITYLNQWLGRFPALKRALVHLVSRVPALDLRLREAVHEAKYVPSSTRVDAAHLPEDAAALLQRMKRNGARGARR